MKLSTPSKTNQEDNILLTNFRSTGDLEVLGKLFAKHSEMVYYVCLRYFKEQEKSKDAVMHIFEELVYKINKQDILDFPKWLYVVSKNHCLMALRREKSNNIIIVDDFVEFSSNLHQDDTYQEKEERLSLLERCIEKLPEKQKRSVNLFFINEKCYKEVSEITGYSLNEVKSYIQNGKRNLKHCMDKNGN
ncbi:RNA polymerase sigma factor [Sphingobacterium sp. LRF_L2]|uniref:RNA polymerase sigma factor n=1 Tax=Sphingobacterium sp. LRF_L2 TaxID=3369421 RepID=UPI003F5F8AA5